MTVSVCVPSCEADIAIVGAGPAGCAAALALRRVAPDLATVLIEADTTPSSRPGEVLPAAGFAMLHQLGLAGAVAPACRPAPGLASCWGSDEVTERAALFSARGADQHLDRSLFDTLLADAAAASGVALRRGAAVTGAVRQAGGWHLHLADDTVLSVRLVIWATGRNRLFLRWTDAKQQVFGRLVGYMRYFVHSGNDPRTLLEAAPDGWWYSAALPHGERAVAFMTDGDIGRTLNVAEPDRWIDICNKTRLIRTAIGASTHEHRAETVFAASSRIDPVSGPDWIAAGDAASGFDPLASKGLSKALRSGSFAAYAAFDVLAGRDAVARARYDAVIGQEFAAYRQTLGERYGVEQRWAGRPFWSRRHMDVS